MTGEIYICDLCEFMTPDHRVMRMHKINLHPPVELMEPLVDAIAIALRSEFGDILHAEESSWQLAAQGVIAKAKIGALLFAEDQVHYYLEGA